MVIMGKLSFLEKYWASPSEDHEAHPLKLLEENMKSQLNKYN